MLLTINPMSKLLVVVSCYILQGAAYPSGLYKNIQFTLIVGDFKVKHNQNMHVIHLIGEVEKIYEVEIDWLGRSYAGMDLHWNYKQGHMDIAMLVYRIEKLQKHGHKPIKGHKTQSIPIVLSLTEIYGEKVSYIAREYICIWNELVHI